MPCGAAAADVQAMVDLHHDIMFFVITICTVVLYMLGQVCVVDCVNCASISLGPAESQYSWHGAEVDCCVTLQPRCCCLLADCHQVPLQQAADA
jgi:hypothetical protein